MLDYRAWIIAGLILVTAAGAYLIWIYRPKPTYHARSLTAAPHPANPNSQPTTKSLHVEGCNEDFIVKPGELVEPRVIPGASLDQFRSVYGKESNQEGPGIYTWKPEAYELQVTQPGPEHTDGIVRISLNGGHVAETLDGMELGLDSFGTIFGKLQDKKVEAHERILRQGDKWILTVSLFSACDHKFRSEYVRSLPSTPEIDEFINRRVMQPNGQPGPLRSDVFMNKVPYDYIMLPSNGKDDSGQGEPSEHD
jgi:hypothetical protein